MRLGLKPVPEPVLAGNRHVQHRRAQINERHVETAAVERDDGVVMLRHVPERGEQFRFIHAGNKLDRAGLAGVGLVIFGGEQDLAALRVGIEHGDADGLGRERPETELLPDFGIGQHLHRSRCRRGRLPCAP